MEATIEDPSYALRQSFYPIRGKSVTAIREPSCSLSLSLFLCLLESVSEINKVIDVNIGIFSSLLSIDLSTNFYPIESGVLRINNIVD